MPDSPARPAVLPSICAECESGELTFSLGVFLADVECRECGWFRFYEYVTNEEKANSV